MLNILLNLKVWLVHRLGGYVLADHDTHRYSVEVAGTEYYADKIKINSPICVTWDCDNPPVRRILTECGALIVDYHPDLKGEL